MALGLTVEEGPGQMIVRPNDTIVVSSWVKNVPLRIGFKTGTFDGLVMGDETIIGLPFLIGTDISFRKAGKVQILKW